MLLVVSITGCLADAALIKDNHDRSRRSSRGRAVRQSFPEIPVEVEVTSVEQARQVVAAGAATSCWTI